MGQGRIFVLPFPCVKEASYYAEFVFILPPAELERNFGKDPELTLADQEAFCGGESGSVGVTGGLYLTAADLEDTKVLAGRSSGRWACGSPPAASRRKPWGSSSRATCPEHYWHEDRFWGLHNMVLTRDQWLRQRKHFAAILTVQRQYEQLTEIQAEA